MIIKKCPVFINGKMLCAVQPSQTNSSSRSNNNSNLPPISWKTTRLRLHGSFLPSSPAHIYHNAFCRINAMRSDYLYCIKLGCRDNSVLSVWTTLPAAFSQQGEVYTVYAYCTDTGMFLFIIDSYPWWVCLTLVLTFWCFSSKLHLNKYYQKKTPWFY